MTIKESQPQGEAEMLELLEILAKQLTSIHEDNLRTLEKCEKFVANANDKLTSIEGNMREMRDIQRKALESFVTDN